MDALSASDSDSARSGIRVPKRGKRSRKRKREASPSSDGDHSARLALSLHRGEMHGSAGENETPAVAYLVTVVLAFVHGTQA